MLPKIAKPHKSKTIQNPAVSTGFTRWRGLCRAELLLSPVGTQGYNRSQLPPMARRYSLDIQLGKHDLMHDSHQRFWSIRATLLAFAVASLNGSSLKADINFYRLFKTDAYQQTSNAQPTTPVFFTGNADIIFSNNSDFAAAQVTSASPLSPMTLSPSFPGFFGYGQFYTPPSNLDTDFPNNTTYEYGISGGTLGTQTASLSTPAANIFASQVPFFNGTTFDQLQGMNTAGSFQFTLNGYATPVGSNVALTFLDIIRVSDGAVVYTDFGPNTQTSFVLPANTLQPGTAYIADLVYSSRIDTPNAGFNGATSEIGYDLRSDLNFSTAVPEPASLVLALFAAVALIAARRAKAVQR